MGRPCTICTHVERGAINMALAEGRPFRDVAAEYSASKTALHRHWQAHVADVPASARCASAGKRDTTANVCDVGVVGGGDSWRLWLIGRVAELHADG